MRSRDFLNRVLFAVLAAGFIIGAVQLLRWRFALGDVYPAYSSLRPDPLGSKALFDSVTLLDTPTVARHFQSWTRLPHGQGHTLLVLGASDLELTTPEWQRLQEFVSEGGRAVLAWGPQSLATDGDATQTGRTPRKREAEDPKNRRRPAENKDRSAALQKHKLPAALGVRITPGNNAAVQSAYAAQTNSALPEIISWHPQNSFQVQADGWKILYKADAAPVILERARGRGTIVLLASSYNFSNEALHNDRDSALLSWMLGPAHTVLISEYHLGVIESTGVSHLVRKYGLVPVVLALLAVAGLFVWQRVVPFLPPIEESPAAAAVSGRESLAGLTNLLRRNLPAPDLPAVCLAEWKRSFAHAGQKGRTQAAALDAALTQLGSHQKPRHPVEAYRALARVLARDQSIKPTITGYD